MNSHLKTVTSRLTRATLRPRNARLTSISSVLSSTRRDNPSTSFSTSTSKIRIGRPAVPSEKRQMATQSDPGAGTATVSTILRPEVLQEVWDFWFSHLPSEENAVLPTMEQSKHWFMGGDELDNSCNKRFRSTLEALQSLNPSAQSLLAALEGAPAESWASLVILLDQVPRNCYRGPQSTIAFRFFDPLALAVTKRAIDLGHPASPNFKYYSSRRMWFYLPLMHSEDLPMHDLAVAQYQQMSDEFRALLAAPAAAETEQDRKCGEVLASNKETAELLLSLNIEFEKKHRDIIVKFGRYPHRNGPLGREMTAAEQEFLDNGGDTFNTSKG